MKVMTAMYTIRKGGSYDRFKMMIESFLQKQWEVHCLSLAPIQIENSLFHSHVMHFPFKTLDGFAAKLLVFSIFPLWSAWIVWRNKIDLLLAFGSLYAFMQGLSKWYLKRPMVTLIRGSLSFGSKMHNLSKYFLYLNKHMENIGLLFSDRIITNNMSSRGEILKSLGRRRKIDVQILYNNIPPMDLYKQEDIAKARDKYGIPWDAKVLVTAGILTRGKNIETLIGCLPKIGREKVYILIAGDSSRESDFRYAKFLRELTKRLEVDKQIIFTGWLEKIDLWGLFLASDLFILPSLNEGMPNAMLEALGLGLPCMGSDIPGIRDILRYDDLLFNPLDGKTMIAKIQQALSDRQFLEKIKTLCQERKELFHFDWREKIFQMVTVGLSHVNNGL